MDRANTDSPLQGLVFVQANCNKAEGYFLSPGKGEQCIPGLRKPEKKGDVGIPCYKLCVLASMEHHAPPPGAAVQADESRGEGHLLSSVSRGMQGSKDLLEVI